MKEKIPGQGQAWITPLSFFVASTICLQENNEARDLKLPRVEKHESPACHSCMHCRSLELAPECLHFLSVLRRTAVAAHVCKHALLVDSPWSFFFHIHNANHILISVYCFSMAQWDGMGAALPPRPCKQAHGRASL